MDFHSPEMQVGVKLLCAVLAGGIIGLERELKRKPAGLRTNILICVSATLIMITSRHIGGGAPYTDPARLVAQVIAGIGFIGAGVIMRSRGSVTGLTTAATIFAVTGIGISIGDGMFAVAGMVTVLIVSVLVVLSYVERAIIRRRRLFHYHFKTDQPARVHAQLLELLERQHVHLSDFATQDLGDGQHEISLSVVTSSDGSHRLMEKLTQLGSEVKAASFDTN
jgi:putative Mg2+ transporter-C (MgtC) family protein